MSEITSFKCACCGAELKFSSGSQKMSCEYCGTEFEVEAVQELADAQKPAEENISWDSYQSQTLDPETGMCTYSCSSCGAQIVGDQSLAASECPYCGNTVVMDNNVSGMMKPDYVIPFKVDKNAAVAKFKEFCKGRVLLPSGFMNEHRIEKIEGVYVPYWLFDAKAKARIRFRAQRVTCWTEGDYDVTKTDHFMLYRAGSMEFDHVPVDGTSKLEGDITEAVEPFDMKGAEEFKSAYLSGFLADRYDIEAEDCKPRANERIKQSIRNALADTCSEYTSVLPEQENISLESGKINYALLPMWLLTAKYKGKLYRFAMNGQTGRFVGELPVSVGKAVGIFAGLTVVLTIVFNIIFNLFMG